MHSRGSMSFERIGIDLDECLAELLDGFLPWYNQRHGTSVRKESVREYHEFFSNGSKPFSLFYEFCKTPAAAALAVVPGAREAAAELSQERKLYVITARADSTIPMTHNWLEQNFSNTFQDVFFITGRREKKSDVCKRVGIQAVVDDLGEHARDCVARERPVLLLKKPWNEHEPHQDYIHRCEDWQAVVDYLNVH